MKPQVSVELKTQFAFTCKSVQSAKNGLPVRVIDEYAVPKEPPSDGVPAPPGTIHIELPGRALISLEGSVDPSMIGAVLRSLLP